MATLRTQPFGSPQVTDQGGWGGGGIMAPPQSMDSLMRRTVLSTPRPTQEMWDAAQSQNNGGGWGNTGRADVFGGTPESTLQDAQAMWDKYSAGGQPGYQTLGGMAQQPGYNPAVGGDSSFGGPSAPTPWYSGQGGGTNPTAGPQPQQGGSLTFQQANDPTYVRQKATEALTRRAQAYGRPAPTEAEIQEAMNYALKPDVYSDGQTRSGWSEYWDNRFGIPGNEGAAAGDKGGASTLVQGGQGQTLGQMAGGGFSPNAQNGVASFNAPGLLAPYTKEFQGTDINTILNAPAFQAAQANGIDELGRSAAARGTLLTGGFGKDLMKYSMGLGLGELNNQFNRDLSSYTTNRDTFQSNQNNAFNKLSSFANTGANIASNLGGYGSQYANNTQQNANNAGDILTGQGDATAQNDLAKGVNKGQTLGNLATNLGSVDWANMFKRRTTA